ncbi:hypothetical protein [Pseudoalteromonas luteoviolacea]|uniref:Uncharacterized protein n=1 Tax=Pseudoalteromonas luteoviolacea DSM 6061 TaxID=1365250 RepID=A0A166ZK69_9GAMM|nr:hypothetical protein [Pseudoalteromonas luteoviolacea]KZN44397.1 hypothetical protein N475_25935 [Pseudoalteromonas luteoviolacea DSM 6061]MBE0388761.1 hypothetical protein [Pseudoalteromonas luteoviolacea DSM 6061]
MKVIVLYVLFYFVLKPTLAFGNEAKYVDLKTGDYIYVKSTNSTLIEGKFIEKVYICTEDDEFLCLFNKYYKFSFPSKYSGEVKWSFKGFRYCVVSSLEEDKQYLVYIYEGEECSGSAVGTFLFSEREGLKYISTNYLIPKGELNMVLIEDKGLFKIQN